MEQHDWYRDFWRRGVFGGVPIRDEFGQEDRFSANAGTGSGWLYEMLKNYDIEVQLAVIAVLMILVLAVPLMLIRLGNGLEKRRPAPASELATDGESDETGESDEAAGALASEDDASDIDTSENETEKNN